MGKEQVMQSELKQLEQPEDLEALQKARDLTYNILTNQLARFNWSSVPSKNDPDGCAFWNDSTAVEAVHAYRRAYSRLDYYRHLLERREAHRGYDTTHPTVGAACSKTWRRNNPDRVAATNAAWYENNPDKAREIRHRRRASLANAEGEYTQEQFRALCVDQDNRCSYCEQTEDLVGLLEPDHMNPISRGGSNSISNITPTCSHCNAVKGNKTVEEFLLYLEQLTQIRSKV